MSPSRGSGAQSKHWDASSHDACPQCLNNQPAGWIAIDAEFPEGDNTHPNCTCDRRFRTEPAHDHDESPPIRLTSPKAMN
ncbi:MAG: hypothetical protein ACREQR_06640 [Candidatus Binataceae bacterium]